MRGSGSATVTNPTVFLSNLPYDVQLTSDDGTAEQHTAGADRTAASPEETSRRSGTRSHHAD